jgi:integrase
MRVQKRGCTCDRFPSVHDVFYFRPRVKGPDGKTHQLGHTHHGDATSAALWRSQILYGKHEAKTAAEALEADPGSRTVSEVLTLWLDSITVEPATARYYRRHAETIRAALGTLRIDQLTRGHVEQLYRTLSTSGKSDGTGMAPGTVAQVHAVLTLTLDYAEAFEWVPRNVAAKAKLPKANGLHGKAVTAQEIPSTEQVEAMISYDGPVFGTVIMVLAHCGMRRGELCALKWSDVDLKAGTLTVQRSIDEQTGILPREKGRKAGGTVKMDLAPFCVQALQAHRDMFGPSFNPYVFGPTRGDTPLSGKAVSRKVTAAADATGQRWTAHSLRHYMASKFLSNGYTLAEVAARLGDTVEVTARVYVHFLKDSAKKLPNTI